MVNFIFGFHCHQPVGNFDSVFAEVHEKSYSPLLRTLTYSKIKFCFHASGILLEWWEKNDPELLDIIKEGVLDNRIELMGGGYYEPILASIPRKDRRAQLEMLSGALFRLFGRYPEGAWITERIWQPDIITDLKAAGIGYAFLDDYQFFQAGISEDDIDGIFRTEYDGNYFDLIPIHERLRYKIPFAEPQESVDEILSINGKNSRLSVMFDDGEKMGAWPETFDWVYGKDGNPGWLHNFLNIAKQSIIFEFPSTILKNTEKRIPVYLPISSYREMGEWTLSVKQRKRYESVKANTGLEIGGGIWHNFFSRYPEANLFHKRMLNLSEKINFLPPKGDDVKNSDLVNELLKSQANDAYWHGVFGGVYLPHLRRAIRKALISAFVLYKKEIECRMDVEKFDFDMDGESEIQLANDYWLVVFKPSKGSFVALDYLENELINSMGDIFCLHGEYDIANIPKCALTSKIGDNDASCGMEESFVQAGGTKKTETNEPPATIHKDVKYPSDLTLDDLMTNIGLLPAFEIKRNGGSVYFNGESIEKDEESNVFTIISSGFAENDFSCEPVLNLIIQIGKDINFKLSLNGLNSLNLNNINNDNGNLMPLQDNIETIETIFRFTLPGGNGPAASFSCGDYISGLDEKFKKDLTCANIGCNEEVFVKDTFWGGAISIKSIFNENTADVSELNFKPIKTISLSESGYERIFQGFELSYGLKGLKNGNHVFEWTIKIDKIL